MNAFAAYSYVFFKTSRARHMLGTPPASTMTRPRALRPEETICPGLWLALMTMESRLENCGSPMCWLYSLRSMQRDQSPASVRCIFCSQNGIFGGWNEALGSAIYCGSMVCVCSGLCICCWPGWHARMCRNASVTGFKHPARTYFNMQWHDTGACILIWGNH